VITHDLTAVFAALDRLPRAVGEAAQAGVDTIAPDVQHAMQDSAVHGDVSGASHQSYRALTATNASQEAASGFAAAEAALSNAPANYGHAVRQPTGITQGEGTVVLVVTDYTSYGADRETAEAGKRAVEGPTLQAYSQAITQSVAAEGRKRLR
jgi:hypothetical protein